jgi:hypothetical protein
MMEAARDSKTSINFYPFERLHGARTQKRAVFIPVSYSKRPGFDSCPERGYPDWRNERVNYFRHYLQTNAETGP